MKKLIPLLIYFVSLCALDVFAQNDKGISITESSDNRIEFEIKKSDDDNYRLENLGENGLMILYTSKEKTEGNKNKKVYFTKISPELSEDYTEEVLVKKEYDIQFHYLEGENLYYLLSSSSTIKKYQLLRFNVVSKETETIEGEMPKKMSVSGFWVKGGIVYLVGNAMKSQGMRCLEFCGVYATLGCGVLFGLMQNPYSEPLFVCIDMAEKKPSFGKWTATKKKKKITIASVSIPDSGAYADVLVFEKVKKLNIVYTLRAEGGEFSKATKLSFKSNAQPISIKTHTFGTDEQYMTGLFSNTNNARASQGIFFAEINDRKLKNVNIIPFKNLKNYKSIMHSGQAKSVDKKKRKGKTDAVLSLQAYQHDMFKIGEENVLISEFFYPTYRTETTVTVDAKGRTTTRTRTVFDGYQYTSVLVTAFDNTGKLLWDRALSINEMEKHMTVRERVKVMGSENGDLTFVYTGTTYNKAKKRSENNIIYATLSGTEFSDKNKVNLVEALGVDMLEKKKVSVSTKIEYWFDKYFIAYGVETSKPQKGQKSKRKKTLIYVTKLSF